MADAIKNRRDYLTISAINPIDGTMMEVLISYNRIQSVGRRSIGQALECGQIMPYILQHPKAIFEGLRRDEDEDRSTTGWLCYCGIPERAYTQDGQAIKPYKKQVYLVFVNDDKVAYNWRWEKADPSDPRVPQDHENRFRRRVL
jgi:hypothetical protein